MLKPEDITTDDAKVIVAYAASAGTSLKSYALDSSHIIVLLYINKARRANWK